MPTGATDPQVSRRCRARLRVRPRRPEEWHAGVARVCSPSPRVLDWQRLYYRLVSKHDVGLQPNYCTDRPVVTRRAFRGNFPTGPETAGAVARHFDARTPRASRALPRANARARTRTARSALQEVRRTRAFLRDVSPRRREARDLLGSGRRRRQSATRPHRRRGRARVGRRGGRQRRHGQRRRCQHGFSSGAGPESPERVERVPRAVSPDGPAHRPFETATMRRGTWHPAARGFSPRARGSRRAPHAEFHARFPRRLPAPPPSPRRSSPSPRLTSPRPRKRPGATKNQRLPSRATARTRRRRRTRRWTRRTVR